MNKIESAEFAKKSLEDLLSFFEINVDVTMTVHDDVIELSVPTLDISSLLIGRNAETLRSFQYLISTTLRNKNAEIQRVNVDIADYKKARNQRLESQAQGWIDQVITTGEPVMMKLNAADRRIIHHLAESNTQVVTTSIGEGRERSIQIKPSTV